MSHRATSPPSLQLRPSRVNKGKTEVRSHVNVMLTCFGIHYASFKVRRKKMDKKIDNNAEQISSLSKGLLNLTTKIDELEEKENREVKDITNFLDDMKYCMGRLTRSEIINKRIRDELTDLGSYSMKTNLIISFNKKNVSHREQPDELSS